LEEPVGSSSRDALAYLAGPGVAGEPRTTRDLDLVIDPRSDQLNELIGALDPERFYVDLDYIERWVTELGLAESWRRVRAAVPACPLARGVGTAFTVGLPRAQ